MKRRPPVQKKGSCLVWFRQDLRLRDNPAFEAAVSSGLRVIPVFIHSPHEEEAWAPGAASRAWLHHSLQSLDQDLRSRGLRLILASGASLTVLTRLIRETHAEKIVWNRLYEPALSKRDRLIEKALAPLLSVETFNASLIVSPEKSLRAGLSPYKVFTAFWRRFAEWVPSQKSFSVPKRLEAPEKWPRSLALGALELLPKKNWDRKIFREWTPGEKGAKKLWDQFLRGPAENYEQARECPSLRGTSGMSPFLHFGEISPRFLWDSALKKPRMRPFLRQLAWREFAYHLMVHFPETPEKPLRGEFEKFPWTYDRKRLKVWQQGKTGYPLVDAGMRELWNRGWMHNRVRMIVASFLVKDLLIPWQSGAKWFWDTLVDADLANNTFGWQWAAGCGADAAPYFRIFNPVRQGKRFDPEGKYVARWVPELRKLSAKWIHCPWEAPGEVLKQAGVMLGVDYPEPMVDHEGARRRALMAYERMKKKVRLGISIFK